MPPPRGATCMVAAVVGIATITLFSTYITQPAFLPAAPEAPEGPAAPPTPGAPAPAAQPDRPAPAAPVPPPTAAAVPAPAQPAAPAQEAQPADPGHGGEELPPNNIAASFAKTGLPARSAPAHEPRALPDGYVPQLPVVTRWSFSRPGDPLPGTWDRSSVVFNAFNAHLYRNVCRGSGDLFLFNVPPHEQQAIKARYAKATKGAADELVFVSSYKDILHQKTPIRMAYHPGKALFVVGCLPNIMHTFHERVFPSAVVAVLGQDPELAHFDVGGSGPINTIVTDGHVLSDLSQFSGAMVMALANLVRKEFNKDPEGPLPVVRKMTHGRHQDILCYDESIIFSSHNRYLQTPEQFDPVTLQPQPSATKRNSKTLTTPKGTAVMASLREMVFAQYGIPPPESPTCIRRAVVYDHSNSYHSVLLNGAEVARTLRDEFGFEVTFYHDLNLDFASTIELFSSTDLFVSPAGGVMSSVMFMAPGAAVLEVVGHGHTSWISRYGTVEMSGLLHQTITGAQHPEIHLAFPTITMEQLREALAELKIVSCNGPGAGTLQGPIGEVGKEAEGHLLD